MSDVRKKLERVQKLRQKLQKYEASLRREKRNAEAWISVVCWKVVVTRAYERGWIGKLAEILRGSLSEEELRKIVEKSELLTGSSWEAHRELVRLLREDHEENHD